MMQMKDKQGLGFLDIEEYKKHRGAHNVQIAIQPQYIGHIRILTDFAKLKKLLVSPVTMLDEPANEGFPNQAIASEKQHLLLHMEE